MTGTRTAIFGHVEDDCGPGVSLFPRHFFNIFLFCFCLIVFFSFVQYAVYDHVVSNHANIVLLFMTRKEKKKSSQRFGSITASQTSVQIVVFICISFPPRRK